ncbi:MAG: chaperone modulator CbpM [Gammaproteobacteria bacterium]
MHGKDFVDILVGEILEDDTTLTLAELCRVCGVHEEWIAQLVEEGVLEPRGHAGSGWRFPGTSLHRARTVVRLQRDLGVNLSGAALALELLEEIRCLRGNGVASGDA